MYNQPPAIYCLLSVKTALVVRKRRQVTSYQTHINANQECAFSSACQTSLNFAYLDAEISDAPFDESILEYAGKC